MQNVCLIEVVIDHNPSISQSISPNPNGTRVKDRQGLSFRRYCEYSRVRQCRASVVSKNPRTMQTRKRNVGADCASSVYNQSSSVQLVDDHTLPLENQIGMGVKYIDKKNIVNQKIDTYG